MKPDRPTHGNRPGPDMERPNGGRLSWREVFPRNDTAILNALVYEYVTYGGWTARMRRLIEWKAGL